MNHFEVQHASGEARTGHITANGVSLQTPYMFPVVNFYGGGNASSLFGGGIYRTVKEFIINHGSIPTTQSYDIYFRGVMTSIASLTDFNINQEKLEFYLSVPIKERPEFEDFDGLLFVDSGGYKVMTKGGLEGQDFAKNIDQEEAHAVQRDLGPDIMVNLDIPITPEDDYETRVSKTQETVKNAKQFIDQSDDFDGLRYLTVHGYNRSMFERFFDTYDEVFDGPVDEFFDGIAIGSLVPKKDSPSSQLQAVIDCVESLEARNLRHLPLHAFGVSGQVMPLLVANGVDSFDSASYIHSAVNRLYMTSLSESVTLEEADFEACDCTVCQTDELVDRMQGNAQYQKDILGPVAVHNLIIQQQELDSMTEVIIDSDEESFKRYLEDTYADHMTLRRFAYETINRTHSPFFA